MSRFSHGSVCRRATAVLCVVLTLNLSVLTSGCGVSPTPAAAGENLSVIALTPDHPLAQALRGTAFEGATAMEVDRATGAFRFIFPGADRSLSGRAVVHEERWEIAEFSFASGGLSADMRLDPATRQVISIGTSFGHFWEAAKEDRITTRPRGDTELDSFLAANSALIAVTNPTAKSSSSFALLIPIAAFIMIIWAICADGLLPLCPGFPILFAVLVTILGLMPPPPGGNEPPPENNPPVAQNDAFTTPENTVLTGNVLNDNGGGADSDPDGDALSTSLLGGTANGTVVLQPSGDFTYTPNANFEGTDTFSYSLSDGRGASDDATVTITVTRVNQPPDARDDFFPSFFPGAPIPIEPLAPRGGKGGPNILTGNVFDDNGSGADSDPDGDTFMVVAVEGSAANVGVPTALATGGTVTVMPDGSFEFFTTDTDFQDETFTYTIADSGGLTDTATVTIDIID